MVLQQCGRVDSRRFLSPDYQYGSQDFLFVIKSEIRLNLKSVFSKSFISITDYSLIFLIERKFYTKNVKYIHSNEKDV